MEPKDKSSFLKEYRSKHPEIWSYVIFEIIFDIIGTILFFWNVTELIDYYHYESDEPRIIFLIFIGILFWIIGLVFLCLIRKVESNGVKEYENYLLSLTNTQKNSVQNSNSTVWICPKCGTEHSRYVGTCGCGEERPK